MRKDFTTSAERALNKAGEIAAKLGTTAIGTEHMLYGLNVVSGTASRIMKENGIRKADILEALEEMRPGGVMEKVNQTAGGGDCRICRADCGKK